MTVNIISPQLLHEKQRLDTIAIVDARPYHDYKKGHIPGAISVIWESWCEPAPVHAGTKLAQPGYWGVLQEYPQASLHNRLIQLALHSDQPIVVYAGGPRSKGREGRVAWMLLYWGACDVYLLNGGWHAWLAAGGDVETGLPSTTPAMSPFKIALQEHRRIRLPQLKHEYLSGNIPALVDTRSHFEFAGYNYAYQPRRGRIPTALHVPFASLFDKTGNFIDRKTYLQQLPETLSRPDRLVAYCEVGVRSALFALLHEIYIGQVVANYDGSIIEWALDPELPMERSFR